MRTESSGKSGWKFALLLLAFLTGCGEYEERERETGYKGLARVNHFLAAERVANRMGLQASSYAGAPSLPPAARTTLILPAESLQSEGQLSEIDTWTFEGGNLIVYLTLKGERRPLFSEEDASFQAFLDYFGFVVEEHLEPRDGESGPRVAKQVNELAFEGDGPYETDFQSPYLIDDTDFAETGSKAFHCYDYGEGSLTVLASAQLFTNEYLGKAEHATLLWDLLSMAEEDQVWFIHSTRISFFSLLWQRFPQAVILLLITIVLLVWWAAKGFGPKFVRGVNPAAKLDEHLEASGHFFLKHKAESVVISQLKEKLYRKLARATNQPLNLSGPELLSAAREQKVIDSAEENALLQLPDGKTLLTHLQTLQTLDKRL